MKLTALSLTSFRSFIDTEFDLNAPRILFGGRNGVGKSGIREALKFVLTGRCQGLDGKGAGAHLLVPSMNGHRHVIVTCDVEGLGTVDRRWTISGGALAVTDMTGNSQAVQVALYDRLGVSAPFLDACLDSSSFLALSHQAAKDLILSLLNVTVEVEGQTYTLEQLEAAYEKAFQDRKLAKAKLKAHLVPQKPAGEYPPLEKIRERLAFYRTELEKAVAARGAVTGRVAALTLQLQNAQRRSRTSRSLHQNSRRRLPIWRSALPSWRLIRLWIVVGLLSHIRRRLRALRNGRRS